MTAHGGKSKMARDVMPQSPSSQAEPRLAGWVRAELRKGMLPGAIRASLRREGLGEEEIALTMGPAVGGIIAPEAVDHEAIFNAAITRAAGTNPKIRRLPTTKAQVYTYEDFLPAQACDAVVILTERRLRESTVVDAFADPKIRTSKTCDLGHLGEPLIFKIDEMMAEALGIHWSYSDPCQSQRYMPGEEYKAHHDYFYPGTRDYQVECQDRGQRTWTFMVYLNEVEAGGGTRFRKLEKTFQPKKGMAVIWNNLNRDGSVNPFTLHHGMKVRSGVKYVITKWFRERGFGPMAFPPA